MLGSGAALLNMPAPLWAASPLSAVHQWDGYAGTGDYARSNGNTAGTWTAAHLIRDGKADGLIGRAVDTGESYDLVVIGGGFAGMSAARTFQKERKAGQSCLLLENHALPGGEAKRNEFIVDGYRLAGPQGSNLTVAPTDKGSWYDALFEDLAIPRAPAFQELKGHTGNIRFSTTNYLPMFGIAEQTASAGYFFDSETFGIDAPFWAIDPSQNGYVKTPFSTTEKADLRRLFAGAGKNTAGSDWESWLDGLTYRQYLEDVLDIAPRVIRMLDTTLSTTSGLGSDAISARIAMRAYQPTEIHRSASTCQLALTESLPHKMRPAAQGVWR